MGVAPPTPARDWPSGNGRSLGIAWTTHSRLSPRRTMATSRDDSAPLFYRHRRLRWTSTLSSAAACLRHTVVASCFIACTLLHRARQNMIPEAAKPVPWQRTRLGQAAPGPWAAKSQNLRHQE